LVCGTSAVPDAAKASPFPIAISASGRFLTARSGAPFPILGRTAWFVISAPETEYRAFIADSVARGYDAIEMHVLNHDPRGHHPPFNGAGVLPFSKRLDGAAWSGALTYQNITSEAPDFSAPNEDYWTFVDAFLAHCESHGILVLFFPAYVGYQGGEQGWMREMAANGAARVRAYGAFVSARYKNQKNLVWMIGGDMGTRPDLFDSAQTAIEQALLDGINSVAGRQSRQMSAEWTSESIATDQTTFGGSMTLNGAYSWTGAVTTQVRRAYAYLPVRPAFLLEEPYDEEGRDGTKVNPSSTQPVRRYQWWGWLGGIAGYVAGNGYVWAFKPGDWQRHLDTQGSRDMAQLNAFIRSIAWYNLVPSGVGGMKTLVVAGASSVNAADYVAAAAAPDGTLLIAYVPPSHRGSISIDMTAMSSRARARWFNPTTGAYVSIGTFPNTRAQGFEPPGDNGSGFADWVLVLDPG
jgi:hypothetical protein